jgi:hypothetical protein
MQKIKPVRVEGNTAYVPLTKGKFAAIDASDTDLVGRFNWHAHKDRHKWYAARVHVCPQTGKRRRILMHRVIANTPAGLETDHIDRDGLNNRRSNLRCVTTVENQQNSNAQINNTSGFKGVSWNKKSSKWEAKIKSLGKQYYLGMYDCARSASVAYESAASKIIAAGKAASNWSKT